MNNNKFNIGDIIVPIKGQRGNTWIVINIMYPADHIPFYALQNLEDEEEYELLYFYHIDEYYERA